ncbi:hypothetical protein VTK26DRAFT_6757 [Humicola hyalothermophila]
MARTDAEVRGGVGCAFPEADGSACLNDRPRARRVAEGQCPGLGYATSRKRVRRVSLHQTRPCALRALTWAWLCPRTRLQVPLPEFCTPFTQSRGATKLSAAELQIALLNGRVGAGACSRRGVAVELNGCRQRVWRLCVHICLPRFIQIEFASRAEDQAPLR